MDRSKTSCEAQGVANEAVFEEKQSMIQLVHVTPTMYFLFLLSTTEAAIYCPFILQLLPNHVPLPTITTVHFRINLINETIWIRLLSTMQLKNFLNL
uniref:Uncharacterized protein n=1 Tax=Romanomermis culicivorax TaxID=13658 RepID=A0A915HRH7_ROMCU